MFSANQQNYYIVHYYVCIFIVSLSLFVLLVLFRFHYRSRDSLGLARLGSVHFILSSLKMYSYTCRHAHVFIMFIKCIHLYFICRFHCVIVCVCVGWNVQVIFISLAVAVLNKTLRSAFYSHTRTQSAHLGVFNHNINNNNNSLNIFLIAYTSTETKQKLFLFSLSIFFILLLVSLRRALFWCRVLSSSLSLG